MRRRTVLLLTLAALAWMTAACGSDDGAITFTVNGTIKLGVNQEPGADVEVCVRERPDLGCVTSGANGSYLFPGIPHGEELLFTFRKDGIYPMDYVQTADHRDPVHTMGLYTHQEMELLAAMARQQLVPGTGIVSVAARSKGSAASGGYVAGVSFDLSSEEAVGPIYVTMDGTFDQEATATDESGLAAFFAVPPGEHVLTTNIDGRHCTLRSAWKGDTPDTWRVPVLADTMTYSSFNCSSD